MLQSFARCLVVFAVLLLSTQNAISQLETPQPSPKGKIEQKVGIVNVSVSYPRPSMIARKSFGRRVALCQE